MADEKRFLVEVGMRGMPFPIRVLSKAHPEGQATVAEISASARIMQEFEASWIDKFIQIVHRHRESIGTSTLSKNVMVYLKELNATTATVTFEYPFFVEKVTPVSKEKCLVRYRCSYSARASGIEETAKVTFRIEVPAISTYPVMGAGGKTPGLFAQLSMILIETQGSKDIYPEELVEIVDRHALAPVYSFMTPEDQAFLIEKAHAEKRTSVVILDEIREELARNERVEWYSLHSSNLGMLHPYTTVIGTEKSRWVPFSGYEDEM
jgi:GTP cyclohydrolase I